jgi:hypothetical protein
MEWYTFLPRAGFAAREGRWGWAPHFELLVQPPCYASQPEGAQRNVYFNSLNRRPFDSSSRE